MIKIKSPQDIRKMKEGGKVASGALKKVIESVEPGISLAKLNEIAEKFILKNGASPSFKTVEDYDYATCINVNEGIVHGIPSDYEVKSGDLVSIDLGVYYKGFHTDLSYTLEVGTENEQEFLEIGKKALRSAIKQCIAGNTVGDVSYEMQSRVEAAGYSVSRDLVGHGIGKELHEAPYVPCFGKKGEGLELKKGIVIAVEVIYQKGDPELSLDDDGWTLKTADNSLSGLFEVTVAISDGNPVLLTDFD